MDIAPTFDPATAYRALLARDARFDGHFFVCVRTTGIYCRPVCPARPPKPENCTFVVSAAAAQEAGFRPCLRCRPETAPDMGAWNGSSNTVRRALALIEAGALDDGDVEALGDRLGVGGRQLRRLFRKHLGASPVAVAQTARVLLAKQLIHDTDLPMADVAFAAGFGSIRRFNETFLALYQRAPGTLRRRKGGSDSMLRLKLRYRAPLDWGDLLGQLDAQSDAAETITDGSYQRDFDGGSVRVTCTDGDYVRAEIALARLDALPKLIAALRRRLDLAADPTAIAAVLNADPVLAAAAEARPGLRVAGGWDGPTDTDDTSLWRPWGAYAARYLALISGESDAIAA
jgi:AraC family transcriptional regulator, regulatory protein of adaptative response / DNA-3-methyladenine glycosylase II